MNIPQLLSHPWLKETNEDSDEEIEQDEMPVATKQKSDILNSNNLLTPNFSNKDNIDFEAISGNINYVNVDNLFYQEDYSTKLSYTDY